MHPISINSDFHLEFLSSAFFLLAWLIFSSLSTWCVCPCSGLFILFFLIYILQGTHLPIKCLDLQWHVSEFISGIVFFCLKLVVSSSYDISNHTLLAFIYFYIVFYQFIYTMYFYHIYPHWCPSISPGPLFLSFLISCSIFLDHNSLCSISIAHICTGVGPSPGVSLAHQGSHP